MSSPTRSAGHRAAAPAGTELIAARQAALAAEHRAFFGYGVLGPRLGSAADRSHARSDQDAHEALRDRTVQALVAAGIEPVPPAADYPGVGPVDDAAAARRLAVSLEDACAAAWRYLFLLAARAGSPDVRAAAQEALTASAVRAAGWRTLTDPATPTVPFPGIR